MQLRKKQLTYFTFSLTFSALVSCNINESPIDTDTTARGLVTDCDYLNPGLFAPLPTPVIFENEMMITDLSVVEDACRTTWTGGGGVCPPWQVGVWTFGYLIKQMSGLWSPSDFVGEIMNSLEFGGSVNGFAISARPGIRSQVIDPWLTASGCPTGVPVVGKGSCPLDITVAPFRLLAIVNRLDLSGSSYGGKSPGEGRFVFGFLDGSGGELKGTIIFEYELQAGSDIFGWANHWNKLSALPLPSASYNDELQSITDRFVVAGMKPGAPNFGSSISQIRTNEIAFGTDWVLREFKLTDVGLGIDQFSMLPDTIKQNPDDSFNLSGTLDAWLIAEEPNILNVDHVVPPWMLGGETKATFFWDHGGSGGTINPMTRHLFGFATCNGCHLDETNTGFTHVNTRAAGTASTLSPFMAASTTGGAGGLPSSWHTFSDPTGLSLEYNEPWRRVCEETRILHGDPTPFTKANGAH